MADTSGTGTSRWNKFRTTRDATNRFRSNISPNSGSEHSSPIPRAPQPLTVKAQGSKPDTVVPSRLQAQYGLYEVSHNAGRLSHQQVPHSQPQYPQNHAYAGESAHQQQVPHSQPQYPQNHAHAGESAHQPHHSHTGINSSGHSQYGVNSQYQQDQGYLSQHQYSNQVQAAYHQPSQDNGNMSYAGSAHATGSVYYDTVSTPYAQGPRMESQRPLYESYERRSSDQLSYQEGYATPHNYTSPVEPFSSPEAASPPATEYPPTGGYSPPTDNPRPCHIGRSATIHTYAQQNTVDRLSRRAQTTQWYDPGGREDIIHSRGAEQARQVSQNQQDYGYGSNSNYDSQYNFYRNDDGRGSY